MMKKIAAALIRKSEKRIGVTFDYIHKIAETDMNLLTRYNRIFGFLDPNKNVPAAAYHAARIRGAAVSDCGVCVEAETNLAKIAKIPADIISDLLVGNYDNLPPEIAAVGKLADAVVGGHYDDPEAREMILKTWGDKALIELSFAMNGAALLPGVKRAMGYATACDISAMQKLVASTK
jgi:hypothetical protein